MSVGNSSRQQEIGQPIKAQQEAMEQPGSWKESTNFLSIFRPTFVVGVGVVYIILPQFHIIRSIKKKLYYKAF
jgi:hypothetical protein